MDLSSRHAALDSAHSALRAVTQTFINGVGSMPAVYKGPGDFATSVDLEIEAYLRDTLRATTGFDVIGEEIGGSIGSEPVWVVDPIDGTANYAVGNPECAMLLSLVEGQSVEVALTWMPFANKRIAAIRGGSLFLNDRPAPSCPPHCREIQELGVGSLSAKTEPSASDGSDTFFTTLFTAFPRVRITGSVGVDSALAALGIFVGSINFSPNVWDNAAGALLGAAAGLRVTDSVGQPWVPGAVGLIVCQPELHETLVRIAALN